jgi:CRISPR system Cascade subunit CasE
MYLSKVLLDWKNVRNPYDWHRALWRLFPDQPEQQRTFLFRIEQQRPGQGAQVLMQSETPPSPYDAEVRVVAAPKQVDLSMLSQGLSLRFMLTANVIKTIRDVKDPERAVRVPLIKEEQRLEWLQRKLGGSAVLESVQITSNPPLFFKRRERAGKLVAVTFEGRLQLSDPVAFQQLVQHGVGPAKSFGCGMLSIARA